jgi:archaellum component FlaF (FlaF/FlaG flagellin family)
MIMLISLFLSTYTLYGDANNGIANLVKQNDVLFSKIEYGKI